MKKITSPLALLVASAVLLSATPPAAYAQVVAGAAAPAAASAAAPAGAAVSRVSAAPAIAAPLTSAPVLTGALAAPASILAAPALSASGVAPSAAAAPAAATPANAAAAPKADDSAAAAEARIRVPGPAATHVADEAAAYADETPAKPVPAPAASAAAQPSAAQPAPARGGLLQRFVNVWRKRGDSGAAFDGGSSSGKSTPTGGRFGFQKQDPIALPNGSRPDELPTLPSPDRERTVRLQSFSLPGARDIGGVLDGSRRVLTADPEDANAVVTAVKAMVDADPARYGVPSADLRLVHAKKFKGEHGLADTMFVVFRQTKDGLVVGGAALSFTIKVLQGKPTVVAQTGQTFPEIDVDTQATMTEDQVMAKIAERTGLPPQDAANAFQFAEEKIIYARGSWRHVKLYAAEGLPFMVAVDMASGLVFAWDNRTGLETAKKSEGAVSGTVAGKGVNKGPIVPDAQVGEIPLGFLEVKIGGKTYVTDKDGRFTAESLEVGTEGLTLTTTLAGPHVRVMDQEKKTLSISVTIKPTDGAFKVVLNPDSDLNDENALAQVNGFHKVNLAYNFLKERGLTTERMDREPIPLNTNIDQECNAFYTPGRPSLNAFKSSMNCVNSAYDTVMDHEYGHYWDDMTGGIVDGGLSEGWGDTLSMYLLDNPVIGEHFLKKARPDENGQMVDYIRHGENKHKYNEFDEAHDKGEVWGGFNWKIRKAMIAQLGDAAGRAMAEALVLPTMFAKAATIPEAMTQVLVNAMKSDGTLAFEKEIRAVAQIHGVTLPENKGLIVSLFERLTAPLRRVRLGVNLVALQGGRGVSTPQTAGAQALAAGSAAAAVPNARATLKFTAGALWRKRVATEIRRYLDETGLKYQLNEYKSWTSSDFLLVIDGPQDQVQKHADAISGWLRRLETSN